MIFDTGASDVTISKVEADFMLKNNYLSKDDIKGKKYYQVADGGISEGTVITLKEVRIGGAVLHNVDASVVKSQKAPLLLGGKRPAEVWHLHGGQYQLKVDH